MKKVPFSIEYKDKIKSGKVEVFTRDGHKVDIEFSDESKAHPMVAIDGKRHIMYKNTSGIYLSQESENDLFVVWEDNPIRKTTSHRIIDTPYGEVMLKSFFDCDSGSPDNWLEAFIGDNYDQYIGELRLTDMASDEDIIKRLEEMLD